MPDTFIISSAEALLNCFKEQLNLNPNPPELVQFRIGSDPVAADVDEWTDWCCRGIAYVRVTRRFPAGEQFPIADERAGSCQPSAWGVDFNLGAFRCAPTHPFHVDEQAWLESFVNVQNDQQAMADAICCWVAHQEANNPSFANYMLREWVPFALQGGCGGGEMTVQAQFT